MSKKQYDYVEALHRVWAGPGRPTHEAEYKRILRKLVRKAVMCVPLKEEPHPGGYMKDWEPLNKEELADVIAEELVP